MTAGDEEKLEFKHLPSPGLANPHHQQLIIASVKAAGGGTSSLLHNRGAYLLAPALFLTSDLRAMARFLLASVETTAAPEASRLMATTDALCLSSTWAGALDREVRPRGLAWLDAAAPETVGAPLSSGGDSARRLPDLTLASRNPSSLSTQQRAHLMGSSRTYQMADQIHATRTYALRVERLMHEGGRKHETEH